MPSSSKSETKLPPDHKPKLIVIVGPTASGKSDLGIFLAQKLKGEIVSADSRQVYKGMDIGSGKVTMAERRLAPHHLLDVVSPTKEFNVEDYQRHAKRALQKILKKKKVPIIAGGTGFYIDALVYDVKFPAVPPNHRLRRELEKLTASELYRQLKKKDPARARTIDPDNKVRLIRALEIVAALGKVPPLEPRTQHLEPLYDVLWLGINLPQKQLRQRIEKRLDQRLKQGMVQEVKRLLKSGVSYERLYKFGLEYRWVSQYLYLEGKQTLDQMREGLLKASYQYARRQMTWFKRNKDIHWLGNLPAGRQAKSQALGLARQFLKQP